MTDPEVLLRKAEAANFGLEAAERLGVRFLLSLEADYPSNLPAECVADLGRAIGAERVGILNLLIKRAGVA